MAEIRNLTRNGETFYPLTCSDAVLNRDGEPLGPVNDIFDVSEYNASGTPPVLAKYESLSLALSAIPSGKQKGGMTIRYVQTSDNKYVQFRCMAQSFSTTVSDWQGVKDEPIINSNDIAKSGGVANLTRRQVSLRFGDIVLDSNYDLNYRIDGIWKNEYYCQLIPVKAGYKYKITANNDNRTNYCFLKSDTIAVGETPDFATGYSSAIALEAGLSVTRTTPADANFLYIFIGNQSRQRVPEVILIDKDTNARIDETNNRIDEVNTELKGDINKIDTLIYDSEDIDISSYNTLSLYINSNNLWKESTVNKVKVVPIQAGNKYLVKADVDTNFALIKTFDASVDVNGATPNFCNDYPECFTIPTEYYFEAPSDANYAVLRVLNSEQVTNISIGNAELITDTLDERVDQLTDALDENIERIDRIIYTTQEVDLSGISNSPYYIGTESNVWKSSQPKKNTTKIVPVTPNTLYKITGDIDSTIAFLTSSEIVVDETPNYCSGTSLIAISTEYICTSPSDAHYIALKAYRTSVSVAPHLFEMLNIKDYVDEELDDLKDYIDNQIDSGKTYKILFIGNSWSRDTATEVWSAANDMGVSLKVCQAYQGGSSLYNMYKGMDDATFHYTHGNFEQYVQGTYQLWEYNANAPVKTPNNGYNNGKCGVYDGIAWGKDSNGNWAAKTLQEILALYDWDIILVTLNIGELTSISRITTDDDATRSVNINTFIARMEEELSQECLAKVKWGITNSWSYPEEAALSYTPNGSVLLSLGLTESEWNNLSNSQKEEYYVSFYPTMQINTQLVANHIGNKLYYAINTAKAIQYGRKSYWLKDVAWHMVRSSTDTHLGNGIPKYICALTVLYSIFNRGKNKLQLSYIPDLADGSGDSSDGGAESNPTTPTRALCVGSNDVSFNAANSWELIE